MLYVKNRNAFGFKDRYDGKDYDFPAGKTVALDNDAARHIFGVGEHDKTPYLIRLGWARTNGEFEEGLAKLNNFVFDIAPDPVSGQLIDDGQGSAPLQSEPAIKVKSGGKIKVAGADPQAADDDGEPEIPEYLKRKKSILDQLAGQ